MSWLGRLILGLGLLGWLLSTVRFAEVVAAIASAAPFLVGWAVLLSLAQVWISAARLKLLLDRRKIGIHIEKKPAQAHGIYISTLIFLSCQ